ncbi:MAG: LegC family aminotransferase [Bacteroidales bacterium]|nr:LegC family aminotransferase [Bacteroidales bacterium]
MLSPYEPIIRFIREIHGATGPIALHEPSFGPAEEEAVLHCLRSSHVASTGDYVNRFEEAVSAYTGSPYAIAMVNGTAALHLILVSLGTGSGDLVLTQSLTFVATVNAIRYTGAQPRYIDIEAGTYGLSPVHLKAWLEENTFTDAQGVPREKSTRRRIAACLPVHAFGIPCRMEELRAVCEPQGIPLVEDAAEALGSFREGKHAGTFGTAGVLSFNGNKVITTGGGGMVLTSDPALAEKLRHLSTQARITHPWEYRHDATGFNYRMPNLNAALGFAQMQALEEKLGKKRKLGEAYSKFFASRQEQFVDEPPGCHWNHWLNGILLPGISERDAFLEYARDNRIAARPAWQPIHLQEKKEGQEAAALPQTMDTYHRLVNLPSSPIP